MNQNANIAQDQLEQDDQGLNLMHFFFQLRCQVLVSVPHQYGHGFALCLLLQLVCYAGL